MMGSLPASLPVSSSPIQFALTHFYLANRISEQQTLTRAIDLAVDVDGVVVVVVATLVV